MPSRRRKIHEFYGTAKPERFHLLEKAAASADRYSFRGNALQHGVVVRMDLNGYSKWARGLDVIDRVAVLDEFFSDVVPLVEKMGGVFFRDEGDCIISLFSDYFGTGPTYDGIELLCMRSSGKSYGKAGLSIKTVVACGEIAIFQKAHEVGSEDWSAEGEAFVRAARLEQALSSKRQIVFFADEYNRFFSKTSNVVPPGKPAAWTVRADKLQVPGLGLVGGWTDLVFLDYAL